MGGNLGVDAIQNFRPHEQLLGRVWKDFRRRRQRCYPLRDEWFARKRYEFLRNSVLDARNFFDQLKSRRSSGTSSVVRLAAPLSRIVRFLRGL